MIIDNRIHTDQDIYQYSTVLFDKLWDKDNTIRGLCVGVSNFSQGHDKQLSLFDMNKVSNKKIDDEKDDKLQKVLDEIRNKYGDEKIMYADMIKKK